MSHWFKHTAKALFLLCLYIVIAQPAYAEQSAINSDIQRLEEAFKNLSTEFYQVSTNHSGKNLQTINNIDQLLNAIDKLNGANQPITAIKLIHFNIATVKDNLDTEAIFKIMAVLLDQNEWNLANLLFETIKSDDDKSILATVQFIFAKYHAQRNEWPQVNKLLEGIFAELSEEDTAYAYLLNGTALQHLKKHRQAIENYNKIKSTSQYYSYAQLNTAIANIRQGWWTDAQTKIKGLIKQSNKTNKDELTNRLYLVLGYALLQREYYRNARDAFRHIGLDSRYTNRALLGIGLTATSQGDYIGGLNALTILKNKKTFDLSVDESYLLVPYVYEKLQQEITVTTSYTEAMNYYQQRTNKLSSLSNQYTNFLNLKYNPKTSNITIGNNSFDYGSRYPESFIKNFKRLTEFNDITSSTTIKNKILKLIKKYDSIYQLIITDLVSQRKQFLKNYLNQSRYGLARLYDSSNKETKN